MFSVWPCLSLSVWVQMNLWRCNSKPVGAKNRERHRHKEKIGKHFRQIGWKCEKNKSNAFSVLKLRSTWKCSCPGTVLWGNSGRNMVINAGRLHSALSLSGPTLANLRTCSGISGALPWSIRRWPRRKAGGARRQRPAGIDRPMLERKPRHPDDSSSSDLCGEDRGAVGCRYGAGQMIAYGSVVLLLWMITDHEHIFGKIFEKNYMNKKSYQPRSHRPHQCFCMLKPTPRISNRLFTG